MMGVKRAGRLIDEVDGMAGNEDRGGVQELIRVIGHKLLVLFAEIMLVLLP